MSGGLSAPPAKKSSLRNQREAGWLRATYCELAAFTRTRGPGAMQRGAGPSFFLGALDVLPPQAIAISRVARAAGPAVRQDAPGAARRPVGRDQCDDELPIPGVELSRPQKYKDMILDIGTEEIGHVEMLATMIARLLETSPVEQQEDMAKNSLLGAVMGGARIEDAIVGGMNPQHVVVSGLGATPTDSVGFPWTSRYMIASGGPAAGQPS